MTTSSAALDALKQRIDSAAALDASERTKAESDDRVKPLLVDMARLRAERDAAPAGSDAASTAAMALAAVERQHANLIDDIGRLNREAERRSITQAIAALTDRRTALERSLRTARGQPEPAPTAVATGSLRLVTLDGTAPPTTPESPDSDAPTMVAPNQVDTVMSTSYVFDPKLDKWVPASATAPATAPASASDKVTPPVQPATAPRLLDEKLIPISIRNKYPTSELERLAAQDIADGTLDGRITRLLEINYQDLVAGQSMLNVIVRPDDFINVVPPPTGVVYIDGEIARPGPYDLPASGQLTLSRLVAAAGGLGPLAIPERVDLVRRVEGDREATIRVNLAAIRERSEPDIALKSDDHVIIGTNFFAQPLAVIRNGFRMTYGFGFLIDRNWGTDIFGPPPEALTVQ
jgi:hypothetical protein